MARRAFRGRSGISQSQRRKKTWVQVVEAAGGSANAPGFVSTFEVALAPNTTPGNNTKFGFVVASGDGTQGAPLVSNLPSESTILRIRGSLAFPKNNYNGTGLVNTQVAIGYGVTSLTDLNSDSYPGSISDGSWDGWMFLRQSAVAPVDSEGSIVDIKAMRKINDGETLFVQTESVAGDGTPSAAVQLFQLDIRILLLLP